MHAQPTSLRLSDGTGVVIRPIEREDGPALRRAFDRLSPDSRYRRFLVPMAKLSDSMVEYLTVVDHRAHEALVATPAESPEQLVGVARYIQLKDDPSKAEVAVTVLDDWQGKGLGTELVRRVTDRAREAGVRAFVATCLAENRDVIDLLERVGIARPASPHAGLVDLEIDISSDRAHEEQLRPTLRQAAAGRLDFRHPLRREDAG